MEESVEKPKKSVGTPTKPIRIMLNEWVDFNVGGKLNLYFFYYLIWAFLDSFPSVKCIQALFRSLNTLPEENPDQYVALLYHAGEPVMGRIWNDDGKIAANFSWGGHEYKDNVRSIQVLVELPGK